MQKREKSNINILQIATLQFLLLRRSPGVSISIFEVDVQHNRGGISQFFHMISMQVIKTGENHFRQCSQTCISKFPPTECNIIHTDGKSWTSQLRNKRKNSIDTHVYNNSLLVYYSEGLNWSWHLFFLPHFHYLMTCTYIMSHTFTVIRIICFLHRTLQRES